MALAVLVTQGRTETYSVYTLQEGMVKLTYKPTGINMNAYDRIVAANLEPSVPDGAACLQVFKERHPVTWADIYAFCESRAAARIILDIVLRPNRHLAP